MAIDRETGTTTSAPASGSGTTVVNTGGGSGGGGAGGFGNIGGALIGLAVLVLAVVIGYLLLHASHRADVRGDAISHAAHSVGRAADRLAP